MFMKTLKLSFILVCTFIASAFSQTNADSIIRFSDLRFHSDFEREAMYNFVKLKKDTFNLFLAIDENLTTEQAKKLFSVYKVKLDELKQDNILAKNINKRVKISYSGIHERFLKKY